jgi:hypothetical protein
VSPLDAHDEYLPTEETIERLHREGRYDEINRLRRLGRLDHLLAPKPAPLDISDGESHSHSWSYERPWMYDS